MQPDLLADIVITNMKHLPENTPPITRLGSQSVTRPNGSSNSQLVAPIGSTISVQSPGQLAQTPSSSSNAISTMIETSIIPPSASKRDPRRDPRRLDPRRVAVPVGVPSTPQSEENTISLQSGAMESEFEAGVSMNKELTQPLVTSTEKSSVPFLPKTESEIFISKSPVVSLADEQAPKEEVLEEEESKDVVLHVEDTVASDVQRSPVRKVIPDSTAQELSNTALADEVYSSYFLQADQLSPSVLSTPVSEEVYPDLPEVPLYVDLTEDQKGNVRKLAVQRIIDSYKHLQGIGCKQTRMSLVARVGPTLLLVNSLLSLAVFSHGSLGKIDHLHNPFGAYFVYEL